jgi:hypothetical protein
MAACDDRQLSEAQRIAGYQNQRTGVTQAVRPFTGRPTPENLVDYINRELYPAVKATRNKVNDVYLQVADNAPSGNPLGFYFSTETGAADPTVGRIRLNAATQDTATIIRVSERNGRLVDVAPWLDVMAGGATTPLGVVTLTDSVNPGRFIRFDLGTMTDAGGYWNLGVTPIESSHDNPFVDGGPVTIGFIPGVGGNTAATVPGTSISGADGPRQFLSTSTSASTVDFRSLSAIFPGAVIYDVMAYPFNAVGNGIADDTAPLNAAIAAAVARPGIIYLGERIRTVGPVSGLANSNIIIRGRGPFNGGTIWTAQLAAGQTLCTITGQYSGIENVWIDGLFAATDTVAIRMTTFRGMLRDLVITRFGGGIDFENSVACKAERIVVTDSYGPWGIRAHGTGGGHNHDTLLFTCVCGTGYPLAIIGDPRVWAPSTAYIVGNLATANGAIWQCSTSGTSAGAGTGPSGLPTTNPGTVHTTAVADGTAQWVFAMADNDWYLHESFAHTFQTVNCGALQGGRGLAIRDTTGDIPLFSRHYNLQVDHTLDGVIAASGGDVELHTPLIISVLRGSALTLETPVNDWRIVNASIFGILLAGIRINGASDGLIDGASIAVIGGGAPNTRDGIEVLGSASNLVITGCRAGAAESGPTNARYGLSIAAGSDNYAVVGNTFVGNLTGSILNTPGRSSTRAVLNNVPDVTITAGSFWGLQTDATSPAVPLEITGVEARENLRRDTIQTVSGVSGTLDIQLADDTTVLLIRTTADATLRTLESSTNHDGGREVVIEHDRLSGSGNLTIAHNTAGTYQAFFNPDTAPVVMGQTTCCTVRLRLGFWRPQSGAQLRLRDADYGDITVTVGGSVWTIDNDVVTNAKLRDSAALSVIGRGANSTGDPADISAVAASGAVLRESGSALSFGTVVAAGLASDSVTTVKILDANVTLAKMANLTQGRAIGRQCDAGTGVPVSLTGQEQAENFRRETVQTESGVSGTLDILLANDTTVLLIRTSGDATLRTLSDASGLGGGREIIIEHDRLSGTGNLTIAHNTAGTYATFFNPNTAAIVLGQTTSLNVRLRGGFWRPQGSVGVRVPDADYGDVTVSTVGTVWTIDNDVVSDAKLRDSVALSVIGRSANSTGDPADIAGTASSDAVLRVSGTALGFGTVATAGLADDSVTNAKAADMATAHFKARVTAGTGDPEDITGTQATTLLDAFTSALKGLAPASGGGTANFLRADGTWTAPASLTDGDKGDITVSSSGAVWTVDANIAKTWTGAHSFTGATHTVAATGAVVMAGDADTSLASVTGGLALGAGHIVVSPNVGNGDVVINATSGVAINAHAATPVTGATLGAIELTATNIDLTSTNVTVATTNNVTVSAGVDLTLAAGTQVQATSPFRVGNTVAFDSVLTTATTAANNLAIGTVNVVRFTGPPNPLTGMVPTFDGQVVFMVNTHASTDMGVFNESASSTAANRFAGPGTSRTIRPGEMALAWYDGASDRWRYLCRDDGDL